MSSEALLLGRVTYEGFASSWPSRTGSSRTSSTRCRSTSSPRRSRARSGPTRRCSQATSRKRSRRSGLPEGDIVVHGSPRLVQTLIDRDLVDELRLMVFPVVLGTGKTLRRDERQEAAAARQLDDRRRRCRHPRLPAGGDVTGTEEFRRARARGQCGPSARRASRARARPATRAAGATPPAISSRVTPGWSHLSLISRPPPKSTSVSPEITARWLSTQSTVSFALCPGNTSAPNSGSRSPGEYGRASPFFSRSSQTTSGLPSPACSAVRPYILHPRYREVLGQRREHRHAEPLHEALLRPRSCHGAVSTIAVSRSAASASIALGAPSGSNNSRRSSLVDRVDQACPLQRLRSTASPDGVLPVPQARTQLAHAAMLLKRCAPECRRGRRLWREASKISTPLVEQGHQSPAAPAPALGRSSEAAAPPASPVESRLRSASAFTSAPKRRARLLSQSHVSITTTAESDPHALL